jgi:hypothetical protein
MSNAASATIAARSANEVSRQFSNSTAVSAIAASSLIGELLEPFEDFALEGIGVLIAHGRILLGSAV